MNKFTHPNLRVVKNLIETLSPSFETFTIDKIWSKDGNKVTVAFTCEKLKIPKKEEDFVRY